MRIKQKMFIILTSFMTILTFFPVLYNSKTTEGQAYHYKNKVLILNYHHLGNKKSSVTITPQLFEIHMNLIKKQGYNVISMNQLIKFLDKKAPVPQNAVVITFDDGYESFYTEAIPILNKYQFVATNFIVVSSTVKQNTPIPHLTWGEMRTLKEKGMSFYSHTFNQHQRMPINKQGDTGPLLTSRIYDPSSGITETHEQYTTRIQADLKEADYYLQQNLENQEKLLAFPFGAYNSEVLDLAKNEGIRYLFTIEEGINKPGMTKLYRLEIGLPDLTPNHLKKKLENYDE